MNGAWDEDLAALNEERARRANKPEDWYRLAGMWAYLKALENWEYMCRTEASATQRAARRVKYTEINAAAVVNEICERRKISRAKLCEAIGTKTSTLQRLMSGDTKSLNLTTYNKIVAWDNSQP